MYACDAHSLTVTTWALGNAPGDPSFPALGYPNAAAFTGVSWTSHAIPSMLISRRHPRNAPAVSIVATGLATWENSFGHRLRAKPLPGLGHSPKAGTQPGLLPAVPIRERPRQPGGDLLVILVGKQRQRHDQVGHHPRRKLPAPALRLPARRLDRIINVMSSRKCICLMAVITPAGSG